MQDLKPEFVCQVIAHARELNAGSALFPDDDDSGEGRSPGGFEFDETRATMERHKEHEHDPSYQELERLIGTLSTDEIYELIALVWLGRGDGTADDWDDLVDQALDRRADRTASYLLEMPLLAEYLTDGLEEFGFSVEDFEGETI
jgi:hypothetical protein